MNQLIKDWSSFCENKSVFADGYFYTLFMENITSDELREIFQYFPNSEKLISKMEKFLFDPKPVFANEEQKIAELERLIKLDFNERKSSLQAIEEFSEFTVNHKFAFIKDTVTVQNLILDDIWSQSFHDFMRMQKISTEKKMYELYNALYGITHDFDYQLYLYLPLLKTSYSGEYLFRFKKLGGIYAINNDCICFSLIQEIAT